MQRRAKIGVLDRQAVDLFESILTGLSRADAGFAFGDSLSHAPLLAVFTWLHRISDVIASAYSASAAAAARVGHCTFRTLWRAGEPVGVNSYRAFVLLTDALRESGCDCALPAVSGQVKALAYLSRSVKAAATVATDNADSFLYSASMLSMVTAGDHSPDELPLAATASSNNQPGSHWAGDATLAINSQMDAPQMQSTVVVDAAARDLTPASLGAATDVMSN